MKKILMTGLLASVAFSGSVAAFDSTDVAQRAAAIAKAYNAKNERKTLASFVELLSKPNSASIPGQIQANAVYITDMFAKRGIALEQLSADGGQPALFGSLKTPGATKTLTFYIHYDGQNVDPTRWANPPFAPVVMDGKLLDGAKVIDWKATKGRLNPDWRLYGRSASDDKAPIMAVLTAIDALRDAGVKPSININFFLEGEEEAGSPTLRGITTKYKDKLASDFWVFMDGPQDQRGNPRVILGVRGTMGGDITVYGPDSGLHSGHYGNFAPNPINRLAHLMTSMRNEDGKILIKGFYDDVQKIDDATRELIDAIPSSDDVILAAIGAGDRESKGMRYEETHLYPALNFRGISSGNVGVESRNVIEPQAELALGVRMVPGQTKKRVEDQIDAHIRSQGYHIIRNDPTKEERAKYSKLVKVVWGTAGYKSVVASSKNEHVGRLIEIMQDITNNETLVYPILGGSLPLAHITDIMPVPLVILPIANQDNSQHSNNENIRLGHFFRGVEMFAALIAGFDAK
jgi:acetylornithine deacetylase/succinyl-diaminopimelate desuccinylase-like protein